MRIPRAISTGIAMFVAIAWCFVPAANAVAEQSTAWHTQTSVVSSTAAKAVRVDSSDAGVQVIVVGLRNRDGRWEEFWRGSDCRLWHRWQLSPGGAWSGAASLGGCLTSDVDGEANADGRLEIFGRGTDNALWHIWQTSPNCCWSSWQSMGGATLTSKPYTGLTSYRGIIVDAVRSDGYWWRRYQTAPNCCWSNWFRL
jgi:hypothetical protein